MAKKPLYVPQFPVVIAKISDNEVTVNGDPIDLNGTPPHQAVISHIALTCAKPLERPIRVLATDPSGTTRLIVHPDGTTTDIERVEEEKAAAPDTRILIPATPALAATLEAKDLDNTVTGTLSNTETGSVETFSAESLEEFRNHAIAEAARVAQSLSRPIRLHLLEKGNSTVLAVHPDAHTQQLAEDGTISRVHAHEADVLAEEIAIEPPRSIESMLQNSEPPAHAVPDPEAEVEQDQAQREPTPDADPPPLKHSQPENHLIMDGFNHAEEPAKRTINRRALLFGLGGTLVLGIGAFAASKFLSTPAPKTSAPAVTSTTQPAAPTAPVPGVEATALRQFPMAYSDLAISADGQYLALQISDTEVTIHRTTSTENAPDSGTSDDDVLSFEGKLVPPILPLDAQYGPGFILRIADTSGALGAPSTLIVWTPTKGTTKHELKVGSQLTSRGGHSWIGSTIPTTGPRTIKAITAEKLETYTAPSFGPALFGLLDQGSALWASIESDNTASVLTANAKGKISTTGVLKRPSKSAVVSKWVAATAEHALMLWKDPDGYSLVLHQTKNGNIATKTKFKLPADTTADRLQARTSFDGNTVILDRTWADLRNGTFGPPKGIDLSKVQMVPRFGGMELQSGSETHFRPESGYTFPVPNQGAVLAVTKDVVILEESRLVSVYRKTTTEGTK